MCIGTSVSEKLYSNTRDGTTAVVANHNPMVRIILITSIIIEQYFCDTINFIDKNTNNTTESMFFLEPRAPTRRQNESQNGGEWHAMA